MESGSSGFKNSPYRDHIELKVRIGAIHIEKQTLLYVLIDRTTVSKFKKNIFIIKCFRHKKAHKK